MLHMCYIYLDHVYIVDAVHRLELNQSKVIQTSHILYTNMCM